MTITVLHNQSFLDIAIQHTGSVFNAFSIASANGLAVSESLLPGSQLLVPDEIVKDVEIYNYYTSKDIKPATSVQDVESITERRGIGWMKIGGTFKTD